MKFRKKPIIIEAFQFHFPEDPPQDKNVIGPIYYDGWRRNCYIHTLEGSMQVSDGDWIITGVNGEQYPCKPDIFEKTYEPVV